EDNNLCAINSKVEPKTNKIFDTSIARNLVHQQFRTRNAISSDVFPNIYSILKCPLLLRKYPIPLSIALLLVPQK
ncbi:13702_t:CDS:2, partial [Dentiscutata heterogama]